MIVVRVSGTRTRCRICTKPPKISWIQIDHCNELAMSPFLGRERGAEVVVRIHGAILDFNVPQLQGDSTSDNYSALLNIP
jgi:hypothetical protein